MRNRLSQTVSATQEKVNLIAITAFTVIVAYLCIVSCYRSYRARKMEKDKAVTVEQELKKNSTDVHGQQQIHKDAEKVKKKGVKADTVFKDEAQNQKKDNEVEYEDIEVSKIFQTEAQNSTIFKQSTKTIKERLENNRQDALQQQQAEKAKNFKISATEKIAEDNSIKRESHNLNDGDIQAGLAFTQGRRLTMEDAATIDEGVFQQKDKDYLIQGFGVFDGHGGKQAAIFVKNNFANYFVQALTKHNPKDLTDEGIFQAFKFCFQQLHQDYKGIDDGTTATVAVILNGKIWVANVGDSRTILVNKEGAITQASEDAKPWMNGYKKKIQKLGGYVLSNRVNGLLAVARAIGDKTILGNKGKCCICPNPKITCYSLDDFKEGYLVLASDGLYDVATTNEVGQAVQEMDKQNLSVEDMSHHLVSQAIKKWSNDNVSVIVVKLGKSDTV